MIDRQLALTLKKQLKRFPILTLTGPRQSGKSTLLRNYFPEYEYVNLERPDYRHLIMNYPIGFLRSQEKGVIFDERAYISISGRQDKYKPPFPV
jgi:predicted AAA+ superfamily ATPase